MKRINKWTCLLIAAIACSACGNEETILPQPDNQDGQNLVIALNIDPNEADAPDTRAGGNDNIPKGYQLRCIVAAYTEGATKPIATETKYYGTGAEGTALASLSMTASLRLMPGTSYTIVAWADYVKNAKTSALYYNAEDLTKIAFNSSVAHEVDDAEDAYSSFQIVKIGTTPSKPVTLSLTRPLAKIRMKNIVGSDGSVFADNGSYQIVCENASASAAMTYDAKTGDVSGKTISSAVFSVSSPFNPYIYVFRGNNNEKLSVWLQKSDDTKFGIKKSESSNDGMKIEILNVTKNKLVEIKHASDNGLKLYPF